jgi:hypothetical protein
MKIQTQKLDWSLQKKTLYFSSVELTQMLHRTLPPEGLQPPYDVVMASECIYIQRLIEPFLSIISTLSDHNTDIFLSNEVHDIDSMEYFEETVPKFFHVQKVKPLPLTFLHQFLCQLNQTETRFPFLIWTKFIVRTEFMFGN